MNKRFTHYKLFAVALLLLNLTKTANLFAQSTDITAPDGTDNVAFGKQLTVLPNGNFVVTDPNYKNGSATQAGAVYLYNGATRALISTLKGSTTNDHVGGNGIVVLTNGNYVVISSDWDNGATANVGAITWCSATTGVNGAVSSSNSLIGGSANEQTGYNGVTALTNGNYVVSAPSWKNGSLANAGAATWGSGTSGISGVISSSNSLVGTSAGDVVSTFGITALPNGNYVVRSGYWNNGAATYAGAVTWCDGSTGLTGAVSSSNSLVGSYSNDNIGNIIVLLGNGNYVIGSPAWHSGSTADVGAVTWCNGTTGRTGTISSANSLVGSSGGDLIGNAMIVALSNSNYLVKSPNWKNGSAAQAGAVTWCDGSTGRTGTVSSSNSLVGSTAYDYVGSTDINLLSNGNYVVTSSSWHNGATSDAGAATWGSGTSGVSGAISSSNSLVGSHAGDQVGMYVAVLTNGNYVTGSTQWSNGSSSNVGAVTWCNGTTGTTGTVSSSNSLTGSTSGDQIGDHTIALTNGNYVVGSSQWSDGSNYNVGAATWCDGTTGRTGAVSNSNSLTGSTSGDQVALYVIALTNGNYVVGSPAWGDGTNNYVGASTWCNGTTGRTGAVSSSNSLTGSTANDQIGDNFTVLNNGNYIVGSPYWTNGSVTYAGAATWCDGTAGKTGSISSSNSLVGATDYDFIGMSGNITALSNGNYIVSSPNWDNGAATDAGAQTFGSGVSGVSGLISSCNSVLGATASGGYLQSTGYNMTNNYLLVGRPEDNIVTLNNPQMVAMAQDNDQATVSMSGTGTAVPLIDPSACRIIASAAPAGASPVSGSVTAKSYVQSSAPSVGSQAYVRRYIDITPAANANTATATITLYYTQADFDDYNTNNGSDPDLPTGPSDVSGKANLKITQEHGTSATGAARLLHRLGGQRPCQCSG